MHEISLCMEHRANTWPGSSRDAGRSGGGQGGDCSFRLRSGRKGNQEFSTRSLFTEDGTGKQETTFFFNDGFGRLTEFHEYTEGARMFLIIRQNMNVVWQGSCRVTDHRFSVYRRESNGRVYFQIRMGQHEYSAEIGRDDRWTVTESGLPVASDPIELSWNA